MFEIGSLIVYGGSGVCEVIAYELPSYAANKDQKFYKLKPLYQDGFIYTPVDTKVFMRPVISREQAERVIELIPTVKGEAAAFGSVTKLAQHYEDYFKSHDCMDLVELVVSIYNKKRRAEQVNKRVGQMDEKFMKRAEFLLHTELSAALGIPKDLVPEYIASRIASNV